MMKTIAISFVEHTSLSRYVTTSGWSHLILHRHVCHWTTTRWRPTTIGEETEVSDAPGGLTLWAANRRHPTLLKTFAVRSWEQHTYISYFVNVAFNVYACYHLFHH